jgi:hypothetical protein
MGEGALSYDADECFSRLPNGARQVRENPFTGYLTHYRKDYDIKAVLLFKDAGKVQSVG